METRIKSASNNPLLDRTELEVEIDHEGEATPSEESVADRIAAEKDLDQEDIQVEGIYTGFGRNVSIAHLKISGQLELEEMEVEEEETEDETAEEVEEAEETETEEEGSGETEADVDYDEIVSGTISDAKDALEDLEEPDYEAALEAEKDNKNRTTFTDWLEGQL